MPSEVIITAEQVVVMLMLLLLGALCYKIKLLNDEGVKNLTNIALYVSTSAIIIDSYQMPFDREILMRILIVGGCAVLSHMLTVIIASLIFPKKDRDYKVFRFASVFGNCGFMGIPLLSAVIEGGALYASVYVTVFNIFTWTYGVILYGGKREKGMLKKLLLSPVLISVALALIFFCFSVELPGAVGEVVSYAASLNTPLAMMVTGASVAKGNLFSALKNKGTYGVIFVRHILISVIMTLILSLIPGVPREISLAVAIITATPVASNTVMFGIKYDQNAKYSGELVVLSTVVSVATIPICVFINSLI